MDCGGDLVQKILAAGLEIEALEALVITHGHPDHVVGFPLVMQRLWLHGRRRPLPVFGPSSALQIARRLWDVFDLSGCDGMPPIAWNELPVSSGSQILQSGPWEMWYAPGTHSLESIGLRFRDSDSGVIVTYSSDTEPDPRIVSLAKDADILVHEATGPELGHTSVLGAADVAAQAQAKRLLLVHLPPTDQISADMMSSAVARFPNTELGTEGGVYDL